MPTRAACQMAILWGGGNPPFWSLSLPPTDPQVTLGAGVDGWLSDVTLSLTSPLNLPPDTWWLVFYPTMAFGACGQYGRHVADTTNGYVAQVSSPGGGFGFPTVWASVQATTTWGLSEQDFAFHLEGTIDQPSWDKWVNGEPWTAGISITVETSDTIEIIEVVRTLQDFVLVGGWNPEELTLVDWIVEPPVGDVLIDPAIGWMEWIVPPGEPMVITLTKWFHVEPCTWTDTLLQEELWVGGAELGQRPVLINKLAPELWIDSVYEPSVFPGGAGVFRLDYGNTGGYENDVWAWNDFRPRHPLPGLSHRPTT
jgi:hypothetical protein